MKSLVKVIAASLLIFLTGCAAQLGPDRGPKLSISEPATQLVLVVQGSKVSSGSKDWEAFRGEWRDAMNEAAAAAGISVKVADSAPAASRDKAVLSVVTVNDYRYLTTGSRIAAGIMTGNAFIDADASFYQLPAHTLIGTKKYQTSSSAWQGVFAPMTGKQVRAICKDIVKQIAQR